MLAAVHELFENQRWNPETRTYGSEFLDPEEDPAPFSNRAHTEHAAYESLDDYPVPAGWEWADDQWTVDPYHNYACTTPDGWLYGATWSALKRNLIEGNTIGEERFKKLTGVVLAEYPVPVRWRRWVRRRGGVLLPRSLERANAASAPSPQPRSRRRSAKWRAAPSA